MTDKQKQKRKDNRAFISRKKAAGWKPLSLLLPPEIINRVREYKNQLMREHRQSLN